MQIPDAIIEKAVAAGYALDPLPIEGSVERIARAVLEAVVSDIVAAAAPCQHESATGVDDTPMGDPWKVWRCDGCGWLHVNATNASHVARMVDVEAARDIVAARDQQILAVVKDEAVQVSRSGLDEFEIGIVHGALKQAHDRIAALPGLFGEQGETP